MPDPIHLIPLAEIDDTALPRDRTSHDPEAARELRDSILKSGLRMPVELFERAEPSGDLRYGILSGFRRVAAFRELHATWELKAYAEIPAFLRTPADDAAAFAAMVEENAIRADLSPWEQGRIAVLARDERVFPTIEEAVDRLYPAANATKRSRIRTAARVVEVLEGTLTDPERLSERQLLRLAGAIRNGFAGIIEDAVRQTSLKDPASQWAALLPYLVESERVDEAEPDPIRQANGRPRRVLTPRRGITIRREMTRDEWILRFTGREATGMLIERVMDEIERMFAPG